MPDQEVIVNQIDGVGAPVDIEEALPRFEKAWNKTRDALFEMLELIQLYQDRPGFDGFCEELEQRGVIRRSVMSMLTKISNSPILMKAEYRPQLPTSYNTLWVLTSVEEKVLDNKIRSNEISQDLTVEEARALKASSASKGSKPSSKAVPVIATIRLSENAAKQHKTKLSKLLDDIEAMGASVSRSTILE